MATDKKADVSKGLGRRSVRDYSSYWYRGFQHVGRLLAVTGNLDEFIRDPRWLTLPLGKRMIGQRRLEAILAYEKHVKPGDAEAQEAARSMGLTARQFYTLLGRWREARTVFSLLPHAPVREEGKIDPDLSNYLRDFLQVSADASEGRSVTALVRQAKDCWPVDLRCPSDITLRRYITRILDDLAELRGSLSNNNSTSPQETVRPATCFGEVVVVDHSGLDIFVAQDPLDVGGAAAVSGPRRPLITLALDLFTRTVLGYAISYDKPGPRQVLDALRDVDARGVATDALRECAFTPRLVFACTRSPIWKPLLQKIAARGIEADVRRTDRLHFGGPIKRIVGQELGLIPISRNKGHDLANAARQFNSENSRLVSEAELHELIENGMRDLRERRLPTSTPTRAINFSLGEVAIS